MKSTTLILSTLLASAVIAQPHRGHLAKHHQQHKRDPAVEWITEWITDIETVGYTTTVWVQPGGEPTSSSTPTTTIQTASTATPIPAQFFQGASKVTTSSSSTSVYVAPVPTTTSTSVYVPPVPTSTSSTSVYVPPTTTAVPVVVAPVVETSSSSSAPAAVQSVAPAATTTSTTAAAVVATTAAAPAATTTAASSGSGNGECTAGSPCAGDMTHYTAGLGACGWTTDGDAENVVALPHGLMGTQSNGNPYCGMTITIKCTKTGKITTARVVDKCMGCVGYSIDLSDKAYAELDDEGVGREGATWYWN